MSKIRQKLIICIAMLCCSAAVAQDAEVEAAVAVSIEQSQEIWAGQQVTVNLDLKTTGFSFANTHFNLPDVSGAFLMQTDTTTIKLSEKKDGRDWQILRYPLALYPQQSGQLELPPIKVRFVTSAGYGAEEKSFEFITEPVELSIGLPPGVKQGDLIVTTADFQLSHSWQPDTDIAKTGDAFTLTVKRRASDISAMLLPPLPVYRNEGMAAYPQAPEVEDKTNRGELFGERTDSIIWVVEKAGSYSIPGIRFQWWDPLRQELKQQIVAGINLDVVASEPDGSVMTKADTVEAENHQALFWLVLLTPVVIALGLRFKRTRSAAESKMRTEKSTYATLQKACKNNQAKETHSAIYEWLAHCQVEQGTGSSALNLSRFARLIDDKQLSREMEQLQIAVISSSTDWDGRRLSDGLKNARHRMNVQKAVQSRNNLAPLNP